MDVGLAVGAVLNLAGLDLPHRPGDVGGDRAGLGVRHQATGAEDLSELADDRHHVRRGDRHVEVCPSLLDAVGQVLRPDDLGPGFLRLPGLLALGEHGDPDRLAGALGQADRATHLLVGLARVDAKAQGQLHGFIELS